MEDKVFVGMKDGEKVFREKTTFEKIEELKAKLRATDYKILKHEEGELTEEEYADTKAQRKAWREEIRKLEA